MISLQHQLNKLLQQEHINKNCETMNNVRILADYFYDIVRPAIFSATQSDPETAHELFVLWSRIVHAVGIENLLYDTPENRVKLPFTLSTAAGLNKNGEIPPTFFKYLGFDRVVIGTVTYRPHSGNPRPRCRRIVHENSIVNYMGLPNQGANSVAINMRRYGLHDVPVTISVAPHPSKHGRDALEDVTSSIIALRNLLSVDRFEINTSCPNVAHKQRPTIAELLEVIQRQKLPSQEIYTGIIFRGTRLIRELREHYDRPACPSS